MTGIIRKAIGVAVLALGCVSLAGAQVPAPTTDILGAHDFSSGASQVRGPNANACSYCHVPHRGLSTVPLWNQTLSTQALETYTSPTVQNTTVQPTVGTPSSLCLSCHDGTVGVGSTVSWDKLKMTGAMTSQLGYKLDGSHPFSLQLPIKDSPSLVPSLVSAHTTADTTGAVKLIDGNIECSTCHNVHNQYVDRRNPKFLVRDNAGSQICLSCHQVAARTVNGRENPLALWTASAHAKSTAQVAPKAGLGGYTTVAEYACSTCHASHNAIGAGLLRKNPNRPLDKDEATWTCFTCHDGSDNLTQPILNVLAVYQNTYQNTGAHPLPDTNNPHTLDESIAPDRNRHATCADCHNAHASQPTTAFPGTPELRPSQTGVSGVAADGSLLKVATYQYENCLRCHSSSTNKQSLAAFGYMPARALTPGDTLNVRNDFSPSAGSSHPVMRDATKQSQPSLLDYMWDISGKVQSRPMGNRILCTDCHNSENNREFGGTGPNGPHGSKYAHVLERRYDISQVGPEGPGGLITNLNPSPILDSSPETPYALCAKCHNLNTVNSNTSFSAHSMHIQKGFSCSVCHSAHGVPSNTAGVTGKRLVNFDMNVVAGRNGGMPSYTGTSCTLTCHGVDHPVQAGAVTTP